VEDHAGLFGSFLGRYVSITVIVRTRDPWTCSRLWVQKKCEEEQLIELEASGQEVLAVWAGLIESDERENSSEPSHRHPLGFI
jgi:hypothetical protein